MYIITTFCFGNKFNNILEHWEKRIKNKTKASEIIINSKINLSINNLEAWWDVVRLNYNIELCLSKLIPIVHCDLDIIIEKDITPLVNLDYDIIISKEIGGNKAYPKDCSEKLGFGICSGFYIIKSSSINFLKKILNIMYNRTFNSYSDQVCIMNYILNNNYQLNTEKIILNNIEYTNYIINIDNIKICVLDFDIITRDPIINKNQFGNHINVDNVGGSSNFIKYFYNNLEDLPLTCRCGKLGDTNKCIHIELRNKSIL